MRPALLAIAVFAGGCAVIAADTEIEHVSRTAALAPGGTLRLRNFSGRVTITGEDRQNAAIEATRRGSRERLEHTGLDVHMDGSTLVVRANREDHSGWNWSRHRVVETDLDIKVPRRTSLDVDVFSGPVSAQGLDGSHRVHAFSSRVRLDDVTGPIRAHTFSGAVDISTTTWRANQTVDIDTFSGSIDLHVPENATGSVTFNSFSGHLNSNVPLTLRSSSRRSLQAELGQSKPITAEADPSAPAGREAAHGSLRFKTFSGSVRINR
jgi:putative adhesin